MSGTHRWLKFWPQDWQRDPALRCCGLAARGLWIDLICIMYEGAPYGHLTIGGSAATPRQIGMVTGCGEKEAVKLIGELEAAGVFSRTEDGTIYSRRMVRDRAASHKGTVVGQEGGNPTLARGTVPKAERVRPFKKSDSPRKTERIFAKTGGKCHWCGVPLQSTDPGPDFFHVDHVLPIRDGGTHDEANLVAACAACNHRRSRVNPTATDGLWSEDNPTTTDFDSDPKHQESESESDSEPIGSAHSGPDGPAPVGAGQDDARSQLWSQGLGHIRRLTGKSAPQSRRLLGGLLKSARDDCAVVNAALAEAADLRPIDPAAWLTRRIRGPDKPEMRNGFLAIIADEGMPSIEQNRFPRLEDDHGKPH